jgi:hypothetical protein
MQVQGVKQLATAAEHHSLLQPPAASRKCRKKQLPMLISYCLVTLQMHGNVCNATRVFLSSSELSLFL